MNLELEHKWMGIGALLDNLLAREAKEMEMQGMQDHEIVDMLVNRIDKAITEEFKQPPLTESDIITLRKGIEIIAIVAEEKMARHMQQQGAK